MSMTTTAKVLATAGALTLWGSTSLALAYRRTARRAQRSTQTWWGCE